MRNKIIKRTIVTIGLLTGILTFNPLNTLPLSKTASVAQAAVIPEDEIQADQIGWVFRKYNGWLQKRRWNYTKGYWVDSSWINVMKL